MFKHAKFNIGTVVRHSRQGYRAVIIDADPIFQASGKPNPRAHCHEFALKCPWYRLLVDDSSQMTYVEETCLIQDDSSQAINNPNVSEYLTKEDNQYKITNDPH